MSDNLSKQSGSRSVEQQSGNRRSRYAGHRTAIFVLLVAWTFAYNLLVKQQSPSTAFFEILDTVSDDFVLGSLVTIGVGAGIVVVFSVTKLYTQIVANVYSFRIIEDLVHNELKQRRFRGFWSKLWHFEEQPLPDTFCPRRISSLLMSFSFIYVMSWIYLILFSEALFFVSWSAGVDLLPADKNAEFVQARIAMLPTLALAIPFSARVMAYLRYPYAQDYADFMPGAVFVLLLVASLGFLFFSDDQKFFLEFVFVKEPQYRLFFLRNCISLAFIPVFFEGAFWMFEISRIESRADRGRD